MSEDMDLGDPNDTGYEEYFDIEIIDGFYYQNIVFTNDKIQKFAEYWMGLYSKCCLQKDDVMDLLNENKIEEAKNNLEDWPRTLGAPRLPQILTEESTGSKRKKPCKATSEFDAAQLVHEMKENYVRGEMVVFAVTNERLDAEASLPKYEELIRRCDNALKTIENYVIQNAFTYGMWLSKAFDKFQEEKSMGRVVGSFDDWVNSKCNVKQTRARQLRKFYKLFLPYGKILRCKLPFVWFVKNGVKVVKYFESHEEVALPWTHETNCNCGNCDI